MKLITILREPNGGEEPSAGERMHERRAEHSESEAAAK